MRARFPTNGYIDAAGLRGRYSFRNGCFPVNVLRGIRKEFGRHSEGIRTKKKEFGQKHVSRLQISCRRRVKSAF